MEISLPDESGRAQILKIHTSKMRDNNVMDRDVDTLELAHLTKNFSGAEIGGLVKSGKNVLQLLDHSHARFKTI
jgi:vesicle-fusing ATPase